MDVREFWEIAMEECEKHKETYDGCRACPFEPQVGPCAIEGYSILSDYVAIAEMIKEEQEKDARRRPKKNSKQIVHQRR